ncbi:hypothetical protein D3C84_1231680 [compost metagenome]
MPAVQGIRLAPPVRAKAGRPEIEAAVESDKYAAYEVNGSIARAIGQAGSLNVTGGSMYGGSGWLVEGWSGTLTVMQLAS